MSPIWLYLFCMFIACFSSSCPTDNKIKRKRVWLDTDFGVDVDDTLALLLLLSKWKEIEIIGIHTISDNIDNVIRARMVKKYITLMGFGQIPVFVGGNKTFTHNIQPLIWNHVGKEVIYPQEYAFWDKYLIFQHPPVTLYNSADYVLAIGPLTNLANLFKLNDKYKIKNLILMGGSLVDNIYDSYEIDAVTLQTDFNFRIDPDAVIQVLSSNDRVNNIVMVTGNITLKCWMTYHDLLSMKYLSKYQFPFLNSIVKQIEIWSVIQKEIFIDPISDGNVAFLHDPLAVSYVFTKDIWSTWLTMQEMEIGFAKNDNNVIYTINMNDLSQNWNEESTNKIIFRRKIMVSTSAVCHNFRTFLFDAIVNFEYPQLSDECSI